MSRTRRVKNPKMGRLEGYESSGDVKKVRDGAPTRHSPSCENHGGCPHCEKGRAYKHQRRAGVDEDADDGVA